MAVVYGIDPGLKNCAIVSLALDDNTFSVQAMELVDLSHGLEAFHRFYNKSMLETGDVYIEFQYRGGRVKDTSHYIHGYLTAMMDGKQRVHLKQSREKFKIAEKLKIMPDDAGDLKIYKNRKAASETVMKHVLDKLKQTAPTGKADDLADALLYALWAAADRHPNSLAVLNAEVAAQMKPMVQKRRIHISI